MTLAATLAVTLAVTLDATLAAILGISQPRTARADVRGRERNGPAGPRVLIGEDVTLPSEPTSSGPGCGPSAGPGTGPKISMT